jgi:dCTP deaminase
MRPSAYGEIDERSTRAKADPRRYLTGLYKEYYAPVGDYLVVHPHQFVLAQTLEYVRLPRFLMAYVVGRSTWGRLGLITATAIGVHPLFSGNLTLEIRNLGETPLRLYPGESIAQLFFIRLTIGYLQVFRRLSLPPQVGTPQASIQYLGRLRLAGEMLSSKELSTASKKP